jgi:hypothetical protein
MISPLQIFLHLNNQAIPYTIIHLSGFSSAYLVHKVISPISIFKPNNITHIIIWTPGYSGILGNELPGLLAIYTVSLYLDHSLVWTLISIKTRDKIWYFCNQYNKTNEVLLGQIHRYLNLIVC